MAECEWIVLCDYAFPAVHGKLCIIGVFDHIWAPATPVKHERAAVAFSIVGEPGEVVKFRLEIIGPTGKTVAKGGSELTLPDAASARGHLEIRELRLDDFGQYAIQMDFGDGVPKSAWFTLKQIPAQARPN